MVNGMASVQEKRDLRSEVRRSWKTYVDGLWEWKHPFFNDYQRGSTTEEALNSQLDTVATPALAQWAHKWNVHGSREHAWASIH